ncbi:MAG: CDP-alcohol phosphatidyltransferase family protein [Pseudomonadota bacterium]
MKQLLLHVSDHVNRQGVAVPLSPLRVEFALATLAGLGLVVLLSSWPGHEASLTAALAVFTVGVVAAGVGMHHGYPHRDLGLCNLITLARLALTAALSALLFLPMPLNDPVLWYAFAIALAALMLDGVDGWAARRAGLTSHFGARFDMEVDSAFALILALLAFQTGQAGAWVIALGLPRYLFLAAGYIWPVLTGTVPARFSRKAVCVLQIGILVAFLVPVLPATALVAAAACAVLALIWSFSLDIRHLMSRAG